MNALDDKARTAWQPLTVRGVAAFARASWGRLLLVQLIVALVAAGVVVWFLHRAWFPVIAQAIQALPPKGEIRSGRLEWRGASPALLADGRFLAIAVDLDRTGETRSPAHVQIEFGREGFRLYSLLGCLQSVYPPGETVAFNRTTLAPWWGAWGPVILTIVAGVVAVGLLATWACVAAMYALLVRLIAFFADRDCGLGASWRLAGAALMPGALLMCSALLLYGWGALDLVRLIVVGALHLAVAWLYLVASPLCLPGRSQALAKRNPFT
jgi:hypothetical protein